MLTALGGYDSGRPRNRLRIGRSNPQGGSAQSHLDYSTRGIMRRECQDLERNNIFARACVSRWIDFAFGDGPVVRFTTSNQEWNKRATEYIQKWMECDDEEQYGRANLTGLTSFIDDLREIGRAWLTEGDILIVKTTDSTGKGCLQLIEAERLVNPDGATIESQAATGGAIVGGVEFNQRGEVTAYHVAEWDKLVGTTTQRTRRIAADMAWFLPNPSRFRAGQVRGEPGLQAGLRMFELMAGYIEDTAVAANIATYFSVILTSDRPADMVGMMTGFTEDQPDRDNSNQPQEVQIGPGMVMAAKPGQKPEQMKPEQPTTQFKDFMHSCIQAIGADLGLPLALLMYLSEQMSFSNLRGTLAMAGRGFDHPRSVAARFVRSVIRWKVEEAIAGGILSDNDEWRNVHVSFPPMPVVDMKTEVEAWQAAIDAKLTTKGQAIENLGFGMGHQDIAEELAEEKTMEDSLGIGQQPDPPQAPTTDGNPPPQEQPQ